MRNAVPSASATATTPAEATRVIIERPPAGLAQGQYAWPAWAIGGTGSLGVALALGYLVVRWRRR